MGATASIALQGAAFLGSAASSRSEANSARAQGDYALGASKVNASLADAEAADAISRGSQQASRVGVATRGLIGAQRASAAASGVDAGSGSAADLQADAARGGALDQMTIRANAAREAWGYGVQAANIRSEGQNAKQAGDNEASALNAKAASTLLTGAGSVFSAYQKNPPKFGRAGSSTSVPGSAPNASQWSG